MNWYAQTEVLFGSAGRGDSDALSDRDILIIDRDIEVLNRRRLILESIGYSVATYTWKKIQRLSDQGALFIQHLKLESVVLRDEGRCFKNLMTEFSPRQSYREDILNNFNMASVVATYPATKKGALWTADVLYVCLRNFGVLKLAERKKFVFSYNAILECLVNDSVLNAASVKSLAYLRVLKNSYRSGVDVDYNHIHETLSAALEFIPTEVLSSSSLPLPPAHIVLAAETLPPHVSSYHRLRNLEKIYICLSALDGSIRSNENFERLRRWIEDPRSYAGFAASNESELIESAIMYLSRCYDPIRSHDRKRSIVGVTIAAE